MQTLIVFTLMFFLCIKQALSCASPTQADLIGHIQRQQNDFLSQMTGSSSQNRETLQRYLREAADGNMTITYRHHSVDPSIGPDIHEVIFRSASGTQPERIFNVALEGVDNISTVARSSVDDLLQASSRGSRAAANSVDSLVDATRRGQETVVETIRRRMGHMADSQGVIQRGAQQSDALSSFTYRVGGEQQVPLMEAFARNRSGNLLNGANQVEMVFLGNGNAATVKVLNESGNIIRTQIISVDSLTNAMQAIRPATP